jgi:EF hand
MSGHFETDITESRRAFECWDLNGDGFIDTDEFHALLVDELALEEGSLRLPRGLVHAFEEPARW